VLGNAAKAYSYHAFSLHNPAVITTTLTFRKMMAMGATHHLLQANNVDHGGPHSVLRC
jgi:hypothetical protein